MSHEELRLAQCEGKSAFTSAALARRVSKKIKGVVAYRCGYCGKWHVGTPTKQPRPRIDE